VNDIGAIGPRSFLLKRLPQPHGRDSCTSALRASLPVAIQTSRDPHQTLPKGEERIAPARPITQSAVAVPTSRDSAGALQIALSRAPQADLVAMALPKKSVPLSPRVADG